MKNKSQSLKENKPLKAYSVRLDEDKMLQAHALDLDLGQIFRKALDTELIKRQGICPACGKIERK